MCNKVTLISIDFYIKKCLFYINNEKTMKSDSLLTIEEVAEYLRVKKRTIYEWVKSGKIPAIKAVGQWRFKKEKIDAWLENM